MTIIHDVEELKRFAEGFLLGSKNARIVQLMARKKYSNGQMKCSQFLVDRTVVRFNRGEASVDSFIRAIQKMDVLLDARFYKERKTNQTVEAGWVVLYATAFPLDEQVAFDTMVAQDQRRRQRRIVKKEETENGDVIEAVQEACPIALTGVESKWKSTLHSSPVATLRWIKLDVDTKEEVRIVRLQESLKVCELVVAVETKGGYHIIIERGEPTQEISKFAQDETSGVETAGEQWLTVENSNGPMIAIPGTKQGGFSVRLVTDAWKAAIHRLTS